MQRKIILLLFLCLFIMARGQALYDYRYWFDGDESTMHTGSSGNGAWQMDLDIGALDENFHMVHFQVKDAKGVWSVPTTRYFIKMPQTLGVDYMTCVVMIDGKMYMQENVSTQGGIINWSLDATNLKPGLHKAQVFVVTPSGATSIVKEAFFFRNMSTAERSNMKCLYSVDGDEHFTEAGILDGNLFHFDLNVANLSDGFHRLTYMLVAEDGTSSKVMNSFFVKTPLGGNGIMQYEYWFNENEANRQIIKLDKRTNPLQIVKLLPVESMPIRSNCFCFEVGNDGKPMLYAKNDLHMRFFDVAGRLTETSRQFVDYKVTQAIDDITMLQETQSFERIGENKVKWFKLNVERGDSVAFRCSQATTIQLFSGSGKELYKANGAESVVMGGTHIKTNGTYYLALHDVTGTRNEDLILEYTHINKFDLFETSAKALGVMPCIQILELDGNGFDNLKSASLVMGENTINVSSIVSTDKSKAKLYLKLDGKEAYGKYDLVLNFDDGESKGTLKREGYVELEPASFDDIEVTITDP